MFNKFTDPSVFMKGNILREDTDATGLVPSDIHHGSNPSPQATNKTSTFNQPNCSILSMFTATLTSKRHQKRI